MKNLLRFLIIAFSLSAIPAKAQFWSTAKLSQARSDIATARIGTKLLFVGGTIKSGGPGSNVVDIYDAKTDKWSTRQMSDYSAGNLNAAVGSPYAVFAQGVYTLVGKVFVYDGIKDTFLTMDFTERDDYTLATINGKILFAGGRESGSVVKEVDIYDIKTKTWSEDTLSEARTRISTITVGNKIFFVGGTLKVGSSDFSKKVDVYDAATETWSSFELSKARQSIGLAAYGDTLVAAGGSASNNLLQASSLVEFISMSQQKVVDSTHLLTSDYDLTVLPVGDYLVMASASVVAKNAQIYNYKTRQWSTYSIGSSNSFLEGAVLGKDAVIATGGTPSLAMFHVFNSTTNSWSQKDPASNRVFCGVGVLQDKIYFAGGETFSTPPASDAVDIYYGFIPPLAITLKSSFSPGCFGDSTGVMIVGVTGGQPPYLYSVDGKPFQTSAVFTGLAGGLHTFTVQDFLGFESTTSYALQEPFSIIVNASTFEPSAGGSNGSIFASVIGGTPPFTYLWNNGATTSSLSNLKAGKYTLTVTDSKGCMSEKVVFLGITASEEPADREAALQLYPNPASAQVVVEWPIAKSGFQIRISTIDGRLIETRQLASPRSTLDITHLPQGSYLIQAQYNNKRSSARLVVK